MMGEFKDKYILAEGYPWAMGTGPYTEIVMHQGPLSMGEQVEINFPDELWKNSLPKYRLVLEIVSEELLDTGEEK